MSMSYRRNNEDANKYSITEGSLGQAVCWPANSPLRTLLLTPSKSKEVATLGRLICVNYLFYN